MKQSEIIKQLSDHELKKQLIISQTLFILLSIFLSLLFFESFLDWYLLFKWNINEIFLYGVIPGLIIVIIDFIIMWLCPKKYYDDGGINDRIFNNETVASIFVISLYVAISEELLFRGIVQNVFGYIFASLLFAIIHIRYLRKPVLFISIMIISFYIGYLYELTHNLLVTITAHFLVDFVLGLVIRFKK